MKTIGIVTVGRVDWNIWKSIIKSIDSLKIFKLKIIALSMHFNKKYGLSYKDILSNKNKIDEKISLKFGKSSPKNLSIQFSRYNNEFSKIFKKNNFDYLCLIGDRFESLAAATTASFFSIPIFHFHGGEKSEGSLDDSYRHAISKLSHVHFVSNQIYKKRLIQIGEEKWRIKNVGAPGLDNLKTTKLLNKENFYKKYSLDINKKTILVSINSETIKYENNYKNTNILFNSLKKLNFNMLVTLPNFDLGSNSIREVVSKHEKIKNIKVTTTLGSDFASALKHCDLILGNSSAGIIETGFFKKPTINLGNRQNGRVFGKNIINVIYNEKKILMAIKYALSSKLQKSLKLMKNPYGDGNSFKKIKSGLNFYVGIKKNILINKKFIDLKK